MRLGALLAGFRLPDILLHSNVVDSLSAFIDRSSDKHSGGLLVLLRRFGRFLEHYLLSGNLNPGDEVHSLSLSLRPEVVLKLGRFGHQVAICALLHVPVGPGAAFGVLTSR